ncbi:alpha/beta-hydrolase family protein [Brachybacterium sp. AOP25-B2-12]
MPRAGSTARLLQRPGPGGLLGAGTATWISTSPSLLPRTWWMWTANVALSQVYGYAVGAVGERAVRAIGRRAGRVSGPRAGRAAGSRVPGPVTGGGRLLLDAALLGITVHSWTRGALRQREVAELLGLRPAPLREAVIGALTGTALSSATVLGARAVTAQTVLLRAALSRVLPPREARLLAAVLSAVGGALLADHLVRSELLGRARDRAERANARLTPGLRPPTSARRSAGPGSPQTWAGLGAAGRRIVSGGADAATIARATGRPAREPIRVYIGHRPGRPLAAAVEAVLAELDRTGAFDRGTLVLFTGTGTGWLQEWSLSAVEFLTGGDCACAAIQYSVASSAMATITDRRTPRAAGRQLFEAVEARLASMPPEDRPRLFVSGESLGAYGGHAAFADGEDLLARVDGAVWTGTPAFTPILADAVRRRPEGSAAVAPRVADGLHVRVATSGGELERDVTGHRYGPWEHPRVVYLQHASDPVARWSPDLLWRSPAWLRERIGHDVTPAMRWFPWITFWQVAADMPLSATVPPGHGHAYQDELLPVWAAVLGIDPGERAPAIIAAIRDHALPG